MKKTILGIVIGFLIAGTTGMKSIYELKKSTAEVDQDQGIYVFIRSKPVMEYEFVGKVNMPELVWSGKPKEMMNIAINRAQKQYPRADAIIIQSEDFSKVDAIKFK